jgi:outer membrane protein
MKILLALFVTTTLFAADAPFKVAFVDLQKALQTVDAGKQAKGTLEKEVSSKREGLEKREADLRKEAEAFEKKAAILNDAARAQKQAELQKKFAELQKNAAESQMDLQKRERELTKPIIDEMRSIIEALGKEKGYLLILERNEGGVLFAQNGDDLTDAVIDKFNSSNKGKKKKE